MGKIVVIGDAEIQDLLVTNVVPSTQEDALALAQAAAASAAASAGLASDATVNAAAVAADRAAAETARDQAQTAAANAQAASRAPATWAILSTLTGAVEAEGAEVPDTDTGTHTDPVTGATVPNGGKYSWSVSYVGWKRIGDTGLSARPTFAEMQNAIWDETGFAYPLVTFDGREWRSLVLDADGLFVSGETTALANYEAVDGQIHRVYDGIEYYPLSGDAVDITCDKYGRPVRIEHLDGAVTTAIGGQMRLSGGSFYYPAIDVYSDVTLDKNGRIVSAGTLSGTRLVAQNGALVEVSSATVMPGAPAYDYDHLTGFAGPFDDTDYLFLRDGQSYSENHDGVTAQLLSTTAQHPGYALMSSGALGVFAFGEDFASYADLVDTSVSSTVKEVMSAGVADAMERRIYAALGRKQRLIFGVAGKGGNRWWDSRYGASGGWKQGTDTWANMLQYIKCCRDASAAQGRKLVVAGLIVAGGESDNFNEFSTGDTASWMRILDRIQSDITTDARAITGQSDPVPIYHYQVGFFPISAGLKDPVTGKACLAASLRNPLVRCLGPIGAYDGSADGVHLASTGYRTLGTYIGNYIAQDLWGIGETPLYCLDAWWDEASPIIHMRYSKPLAIDDGSIINLTGLGAGKGVDFTDGSASPPNVTGIAVNGSNSRQLDVTLSALPTGRRPQVHVGCRATGTNHGNQTGLRCAVRSADLIDTDTITGDEIYHWACAQTVNVPL